MTGRDQTAQRFRSEIERLRQNLPNTLGGRDWARRLLERHQNGDPRPPACVAMARAALEVYMPEENAIMLNLIARLRQRRIAAQNRKREAAAAAARAAEQPPARQAADAPAPSVDTGLDTQMLALHALNSHWSQAADSAPPAPCRAPEPAYTSGGGGDFGGAGASSSWDSSPSSSYSSSDSGSSCSSSDSSSSSSGGDW